MVRFSKVRLGAKWIIVTIHPRWAIEEYARIFRSCVWLSPPHPPRTIEAIPKVIRMFGLRRG